MERASRLLVAATLAFGAGCAEPEPAAPRDPFIALARDFEGFVEWPRFTSAGTAIPEGATPGPTFVYAREILPVGVARMPVGTMLLKTIENGPPTDWFVHAMVKRSGDFNPGGTVGWEFFELALTDDLEPVILWRGEGPPSGHGYAAAGVPDPEAIPLVCNDCHSAAWMTDGVLSPELVER